MEFKFQIGDWVQHKQAGLHKAQRAKRNEPVASKLEETLGMDSTYPIAMCILSRLYEECPGGVQIHYSCRCGLGAPINFHEMELEPYEIA